MPPPIPTVSLPPPASTRMKLIPRPEGQVAVVSGPVGTGSIGVSGAPVDERCCCGCCGTARGAPEAVQPDPSRVSTPVGSVTT